jgi:hypothetical protein
MIKPPDIEDDNWEIIVAAAAGDAPTLRRLLDGDPTLSRRGYFYTPPIHFAVREGHAEIVQMLLDAGADSEWNGYYGDSLIGMARERGHDAVAATLERARDRQGRTPPAETRKDHPIHLAAETGDLRQVRELLDADPQLLNVAQTFTRYTVPAWGLPAASARTIFRQSISRSGVDAAGVCARRDGGCFSRVCVSGSSRAGA